LCVAHSEEYRTSIFHQLLVRNARTNEIITQYCNCSIGRGMWSIERRLASGVGTFLIFYRKSGHSLERMEPGRTTQTDSVCENCTTPSTYAFPRNNSYLSSKTLCRTFDTTPMQETLFCFLACVLLLFCSRSGRWPLATKTPKTPYSHLGLSLSGWPIIRLI
jgi:hypothetical protein